jgi:hypothetical protein
MRTSTVRTAVSHDHATVGCSKRKQAPSCRPSRRLHRLTCESRGLLNTAQ